MECGNRTTFILKGTRTQVKGSEISILVSTEYSYLLIIYCIMNAPVDHLPSRNASKKVIPSLASPLNAFE